MVKEDCVSYRIAKLLKKKGFDGDCYRIYCIDGTIVYAMELYGEVEVCNSDCIEGDITAPTLQIATKWLREVHHCYIQVMLDSWACDGHSGYYVVLQRTDNDFEMMLQDAVDEVFYPTYEEACEAAIKYCLENLIY